MKLVRLNIFSVAIFGAMIAFTGCKKDDGPIPSRVAIETVPAVTTNIETGTSATITFSNQAAFSGKFKVALYFSGATPPDKVELVIRKNGAATNVKLYKADITTLPATFTVTAAEIATLFGTPLALNDTYDFAPNLYVGTKKYEAFPAVGAGSNPGIVAMPGFGEYVRYSVK